MKLLRWLLAVAAVFAVLPAFAETKDDEVDSDRVFELPGAGVTSKMATTSVIG